MISTIIISVLSAIVAILLVGMLIFFYQKKTPKNQECSIIEDTPNYILSIREIAQLVTASYFCEEIVAIKKKKNVADNKVGNFLLRNHIGGKMADDYMTSEFCLIAKGVVRAGYDFKDIKESDCVFNNGVLSIRLPEPKILDIIVNPKKWEYYIEEGDWTDEEINQCKDRAVDQIKSEALTHDILARAKNTGKKQIQALLMGFGAKEVVLIS